MTTLTTPLDVPVATARPSRRSAGRRLLAASLVVQPALLAVNATFHPDVELSGESILAGAAEGPTRWYVVHVVAALGGMCAAPVGFALHRLVAERGRALADAALVASLVAAVLLPLAFMAEASAFTMLAEADISHADAVAMAEDYTSTPEFLAVGVGVLMATLSVVVFAVALLRSGGVPRWAPAAMIVGSVGTMLGPPGTPVGPVGFVLIAVAGAALAPRLRRG